MDSQAQQNNGDAPELNLFGAMAAKVLEYGNNASSNVQDAFSRMTIHSWLRLTVIVCGYMLLRPYAMKWAAKGAVQKMEDEDAKEKEQKADITPNDLRGVKDQLYEQEGDDDDDGDDGDATGANWGKKARVRQRTMIKQLLEAEERRRLEEEEDKDIQEFLED
ncbi:hypothetical protein K4F52_009040 [Lecanicillium sp. MT-2017a]|nr:hypothetical protein K4F52_009040 [Lecanicillium sp. MT-2017a]